MLRGKSRVYGNKRSKTLYISIPSAMATDSNFDFKPGEEIDLESYPALGTLVISHKEKRKKGKKN